MLSLQINDTLTYFAEHSKHFSHDLVNRYLAGERITPRLLWENVRGQVVPSEAGYVVFDDTVLDKSHSKHIDLVRRQYSGNAKSVIRGIGVVNCVYVNPETQQFWVIDYRIYDPGGDNKSKLDHVKEMLNNLVHHKQLDFKAVLMDRWYAAKWLMLHIESLKKLYYCPLKSNRLINESGERGHRQGCVKQGEGGCSRWRSIQGQRFVSFRIGFTCCKEGCEDNLEKLQKAGFPHMQTQGGTCLPSGTSPQKELRWTKRSGAGFSRRRVSQTQVNSPRKFSRGEGNPYPQNQSKKSF